MISRTTDSTQPQDNTTEAHTNLLAWAQEQGIKLNGVKPRALPGRGLGIVATRPLQPNETILHISPSCFRTADTARPRLRKLTSSSFAGGGSSSSNTSLSSHAILAADLALDFAKPNSPRSQRNAPWTAVLPSQEDLFSCLPLAWAETGVWPDIESYLPPAARKILSRQRGEFSTDWDGVKDVLEKDGVTREAYLHAWGLVNTRSFYWHVHHPRHHHHHQHLHGDDSHHHGSTSSGREDRICLQPLADLLNHSSSSPHLCTATFTSTGFHVRTTTPLPEGSEILVRYGRHANDALLVEYGFLPSDLNPWDETPLDDAVIPLFNSQLKELLEENGFWGGYVLDAKTVCYRTQVALRLLLLWPDGPGGIARWKRWVDEGEDGGEEVQRRVDGMLVGILEKYLNETVERMVREVEGCKGGTESQRQVVAERWRQIGRLMRGTIERLACGES